MKRQLKKDLKQKLSSITYLVSDACAAVGVQEIEYARDCISRRAREMMILLEEVMPSDLNTDFVIECEGSVDNATKSVELLDARAKTQRLKARPFTNNIIKMVQHQI